MLFSRQIAFQKFNFTGEREMKHHEEVKIPLIEWLIIAAFIGLAIAIVCYDRARNFDAVPLPMVEQQ